MTNSARNTLFLLFDSRFFLFAGLADQLKFVSAMQNINIHPSRKIYKCDLAPEKRTCQKLSGRFQWRPFFCQVFIVTKTGRRRSLPALLNDEWVGCFVLQGPATTATTSTMHLLLPASAVIMIMSPTPGLSYSFTMCWMMCEGDGSRIWTCLTCVARISVKRRVQRETRREGAREGGSGKRRENHDMTRKGERMM